MPTLHMAKDKITKQEPVIQKLENMNHVNVILQQQIKNVSFTVMNNVNTILDSLSFQYNICHI